MKFIKEFVTLANASYVRVCLVKLKSVEQGHKKMLLDGRADLMVAKPT